MRVWEFIFIYKCSLPYKHDDELYGSENLLAFVVSNSVHMPWFKVESLGGTMTAKEA